MSSTASDGHDIDHQREIVIRWHIDDVLEIRPDLNETQAWQVLQWAKKTHDAGIGINWHTLESDAEFLFGTEP